MNSVGLGNGLCHLGGYDTLYSACILRQSSGCLARIYDIVEQQNAELVAGDGDIIPTRAHHNAYAVRIGIGSDYKIAADLLCKIDRKIKALGVFRGSGFRQWGNCRQ